MPFKNFSMWRGRLPHWRADDVTYYVTFRHSRDLTTEEVNLLTRTLLKPEARQWDLLILCVLPGATELMFTVRENKDGQPYELSEIVEKAKQRVGRQIVKKTAERFPPFYQESYDRIVRDDTELEERWLEILESPVKSELCENPEEWLGLYVAQP